MRFDMLSVWSQWLMASQALLENAWEKDGLTGFGDHHDHNTRDDHDGRKMGGIKKKNGEKTPKGGEGRSQNFRVFPKKKTVFLMPSLIWPGCHAALKGFITSSFIHNLTLFHCFFFCC